MENVIIWGAGDIAKRLRTLNPEYRVIVYVDSNAEKVCMGGEKSLLSLRNI